MQEHISCCAGQAGFNFSFDIGKIINYQDNFNKTEDLPSPYITISKQHQGVLFFLWENVCD